MLKTIDNHVTEIGGEKIVQMRDTEVRQDVKDMAAG